jgi:hypothetical protein
VVAMIHDVDESLRALIKRDVLAGSDVEIAFDAPTKEWAARQNTPTVDVYLYDIRENLMRRDVGYEDVRDESGRVVERRPPARRFNLSYLVTAWTQRPEDEHRLLSALLLAFLRHEVLPEEVLAGELVDLGTPVHLRVALPTGEDRSLSDTWNALGGELKPSVDLVVVAPVPTGRSSVAGPPVVELPRFEFSDSADDDRKADTGAPRGRRQAGGGAGRPANGGGQKPGADGRLPDGPVGPEAAASGRPVEAEEEVRGGRKPTGPADGTPAGGEGAGRTVRVRQVARPPR